jgi:hypothetical protein
MGRTRQGLRKLSADPIDKASDETAAQVVRLMLAAIMHRVGSPEGRRMGVDCGFGVVGRAGSYPATRLERG